MTTTTAGFSAEFSTFIADRTRDFTGREWVFAEIDRWLMNPDGPSFFIITGEPGVGKSAIAARLTQVRDLAAYHFCIASDLKTIDPASFARSISLQLCRFDGFAAGILKDSNIDLCAVQNIQANYGQAIAFKIETLVVNAPTASDAFVHAVLEPLKTLCSDGFEQQVIILVDAMDEAAHYERKPTIVDLLANAGLLPRQVRFVLTSRPEEILSHFERRQVPHFLLDARRPENMQDIRRYMRKELADVATGLSGQLAERGIAETTFVERVTTASGGNFLYAVWLLRNIKEGTQRLDDLEALPQGLDGIYREFLSTRRVGEDIQGWRALYRPILDALVVAQTPLSIRQVAQFSGLSAQDVDDGLQDLGQFLDPASAGQGRYFVYHQSVNDWLQNRARNRAFWIDGTPIHQRIVSHYRQDASSWDEINWDRLDRIDQCGLDYLSSHLYALRDDPAYRDQLYGLACRSVMLGKRKRTWANRFFANDLDLASKAAAGEAPPNWVQMGRPGLAYATLGSLAANVPPSILAALAATGQVGRAFAYAALVQDKAQQVRCYLEIAQSLIQLDHRSVAKQALERTLAAAESIPDHRDRSNALREVAQTLVRAGQPEQAMAAAEAITDDVGRSKALIDVAQALVQAGQPERAAQAFEWALAAAEAIWDDEARSEARSLVAQRLVQAGQPERAAQALERALAAAEVIRDDGRRSVALSLLAQALGLLAQAGRIEETRRRVAALQKPGVPVTAAIQGTGGMGKTTLARKIAHELAPQFPGGVLWVEIGPSPAKTTQALGAKTTRQTQQASVLAKIAHRVHIDLSLMLESDERLALIRDSLVRYSRLLVVLDDLWDVDLGRWLLKEVLPADRVVLLTSRNLGLCRDLARTVEILEPMQVNTGALDLISQHLEESLDGFEDAAQQLVVLLEGHPLALALAAKKCLAGPQELPWLLRRLEGKPLLNILKLPGEEQRDTSVEACLALSYEYLSSDQQRRFRGLGIFAPGPFDLPALAAVWKDAAVDAAEAAIEDVLRPRGLLEWDEQTARMPQTPVYRQHSLLRAYALALLEGKREQADAAASHATWYAEAMHQAHTQQRYFQMLPALSQLRFAFAWGLVNDLSLAQDLVSTTFELLTGFGYSGEHHAMCRQTLDAARLQGDQNAVASALTSLGSTLSRVATLPGVDRAERLFEALAANDETLRFLRPDTSPVDYAITLNNRATLLRELATLPGEDRNQRLSAALAANDEALRFLSPDAAQQAYATTQNDRGLLLSDLAALPGANQSQRLLDALVAYDEALRFRRLKTAPLDYAQTQNNRANLLCALAALPGEDRLARLAQALQVAWQGVSLFAQLQHERYLATSQDTLRQVAAACSGDFEALWAALDAGPPPEWLAAGSG